MRHSFDFDHLVKREMSSYIEQINVIRLMEVTLFISLFLINCKQIVGGTDEYCESETIQGPESIDVTWPQSTASNGFVASNCLKYNKLLLLRECKHKSWDPLKDVAEEECKHYQQSYKNYGKCPPNYIQFDRLCYHLRENEYWEDDQYHCLHTGGSALSFLDLPTVQQYNLLNNVASHLDEQLVGVGIPAKNTLLTKTITSDTDYSKEDVELQWLLPGRYGSVLKFSNNATSVNCLGYKNVCVGMCLFLNRSESTSTNPFLPSIQNCNSISNVLCVAETNSVMSQTGCSQVGYFHETYKTSNYFCYSIKVLDKPISIQEVDSGPPIITSDLCDGNRIFEIDTLESHIIYSQLVRENTQPTKHHRCLFSVASSNNLITYVNWLTFNDDQLNQIEFTNWDQKMDFTAIKNRANSLLTVKPDGKWSWVESATCIVCVMDDPPSSDVHLIMKFDTNESILSLQVIGQKYLWKNHSSLGFLCFARNNNVYRSDLQVIRNEALDYFSVENVGAGFYWCSGHVIRSFIFIEADEVYAFGMIFSVYIGRHCSDKCIEQNDHRDKCRELLEAVIDEDLMKIEDFQFIEHDMDYTDTYIKLMFHMTISINETRLLENEPNEIGLSEKQLICYYALQRLQKLAIANTDSEFDMLSIASRDFCLPDSLTTPETINWKAAATGETIILTDNCLNLTRTCLRSGSKGAIWDKYIVTFACDDQHQSNATKSLVDLRNKFVSPEQTSAVLVNLTVTLKNVTLIADDVFLVSQMIEQISNYLLTDQLCLEYCELKKIFEIFNSLMSIEEDVAQATTKWNSTDTLLASLDEILIHQTKTSIINHTFFSDGIASIQTPLLMNFVFDPSVSGVSGIVLLENATNENFLSYSVRYLQPNQSVEDLLDEVNLVVASFIPQKLLETWNEPKIIFTIFSNDILFQSSDKHFRADGKIISLNILNSDSIFPSSIPLYFRSQNAISQYNNNESICGYWSFTSINGWASTGCLFKQFSSNNSIPNVLCECLHLTHFGNLISTDSPFNEFNEKVLNLITLTGCSLSLFGILAIFITALVFRSWRSKSSSKFLLQLSAAIALQMILLILMHSDEYIPATIAGNKYGCIAIGALIHYSVLVVFFWMLIVAYLQFIRYVIVFSQLTTANFLIKSSIFGWGLPLLPVLLVIAIDPKSYIPPSSDKLCYPSGYALLFGVLVPISIIVIANIFVFVSVIVSLIKGSSKSSACKINADKNEAIWSQLRLSFFLFFLLGISWIFGFLSINGSILFSYLFCLTATMQGFVLFLYFVLLDPVARNLWKKLFDKILRQHN